MARATRHDPFGDFQTPADLAAEVWRVVDLEGVEVFVEPTVGEGVFLATAPDSCCELPWVAYDVAPGYVERARVVASERRLSATVECRDAFQLEESGLGRRVAGRTVMAIGNPPWVTSSAQTRIGARNLPTKVNRFGLRGLDAMTGKANFDIAEAVLLSVMAALSDAAEVRFAFLVKRSVAMKMARDVLCTPGIVAASFARIDARRWFNVSVEAGLLQLTFECGASHGADRVLIADNLGGPFTRAAGFVDGMFVDDLDGYSAVRSVEATNGERLGWRQGIKHDLSRVLELRQMPKGLVNGFGEPVEVEEDVLCPYYKSSDVAACRSPRLRFPLYQHNLTGPAEDLGVRWPKLAAYLAANRERFVARGSRIYNDKPDYMLFGVGPYTLAPFKVAISGFYKQPLFALLEPDGAGRPPLVDDTCYMLAFTDGQRAREVASYLNSSRVQRFLQTIADLTAKRPYTKDILSRIAPPDGHLLAA
jgi:hypothetical protein